MIPFYLSVVCKALNRAPSIVRGNLDKFYVSEFIVGVIKIAIPTSKMESDDGTLYCLQCIPIQVVKRQAMNHRCLFIHVGIYIYEIFLLFFQN